MTDINLEIRLNRLENQIAYLQNCIDAIMNKLEISMGNDNGDDDYEYDPRYDD